MSSKKLEKHINLKLKPSMFELWVKWICRSYCVCERCQPDPDKSEELKSRTVSKNVKESRFFNISLIYYRCFLKIMQELFTLSFFLVSFWQDTPQQKNKGKKSRKGAVRTLHSYLLLPFMSISDDVDTEFPKESDRQHKRWDRYQKKICRLKIDIIWFKWGWWWYMDYLLCKEKIR